MHPLHGNVDTRLAKLDRGDTDALVLAVAGLTRLGRADRIDEILPARPRRRPRPARARSRSRCAPTTPRRSRPWAGSTTRRRGSPSRPSARSSTATGGGCRSPIGVVGRVTGESLELVAAAERAWAPGAGRTDRRACRSAGSAAPPRPPGAGTSRCGLAARVVTLREPAARRSSPAPTARRDRSWRALAAAGVDAVARPDDRDPPGPRRRRPRRRRPRDRGRATRVVVTSANAASATLDAMARLGVDPRGLRLGRRGQRDRRSCSARPASPGSSSRPAPTAPPSAAELPVAAGERDPGPARRHRRPGPRDAPCAGAAPRCARSSRTGRVEAPGGLARALLAAALDDGPLDALVLTSGSTVRGLLALAGATAPGPRSSAIPVVAAGRADRRRGARRRLRHRARRARPRRRRPSPPSPPRALGAPPVAPVDAGPRRPRPRSRHPRRSPMTLAADRPTPGAPRSPDLARRPGPPPPPHPPHRDAPLVRARDADPSPPARRPDLRPARAAAAASPSARCPASTRVTPGRGARATPARLAGARRRRRHPVRPAGRARTPSGPAPGSTDGIVQETLRRLRDADLDLVLIADTCLCEYTDHGHCGPLAGRRPGRQRRHDRAARRGPPPRRPRPAPTSSPRAR